MTDLLDRAAGSDVEPIASSERDGDGAVSPGRAVRRHCVDCAGSSHEVALCPATACSLWPHRFGHRPDAATRAEQADVVLHPAELELKGRDFTGTALKAIKLRCLDCSGAIRATVERCALGAGHADACDLHPFRLGKNPNIVLSEEARAAIAERGRAALANMRSAPKTQLGNAD